VDDDDDDDDGDDHDMMNADKTGRVNWGFPFPPAARDPSFPSLSRSLEKLGVTIIGGFTHRPDPPLTAYSSS